MEVLRCKSISIIEQLLLRCVLPFEVDLEDDGIVDELSKQKQFQALFKTEAFHTIYRVSGWCSGLYYFGFDHPQLRVTAPLMLYPYLKDARNKMTRVINKILDQTNLIDNRIFSNIICDYLYFDYNNYYDMNLIDKILQNNNCNHIHNKSEIERNVIFKAVLLLNDMYFVPITDNQIFFDQLIKYYCSDAAFCDSVFGKKGKTHKQCQYLDYNVMLTLATTNKTGFNPKGILQFISLMNKHINNIYRTKLLFWNNDNDNLLTFVEKLMNSVKKNLINRHNIDEWIKFFTCISQLYVRINGNTIRKILKSKIIPLIIGMLTFKNKESRWRDNVKQFEYIDGNDIDSKEYSNYLLCFEIIKCLRDNFFRDNIYNYPWYLFDWEQFEPIHAIQCLYTYVVCGKR